MQPSSQDSQNDMTVETASILAHVIPSFPLAHYLPGSYVFTKLL